MTDKEVLDLHVLERRRYNLLLEVLQLSKDIGESIDRNDQISLRSLLVERHEPIEKLEGMKGCFANTLAELPPEEAKHLREVLGGRDSKTKAEEGLKNQANTNKELLDQVLTLDKKINQRIAGEDSIYHGKK